MDDELTIFKNEKSNYQQLTQQAINDPLQIALKNYFISNVKTLNFEEPQYGNRVQQTEIQMIHEDQYINNEIRKLPGRDQKGQISELLFLTFYEKIKHQNFWLSEGELLVHDQYKINLKDYGQKAHVAQNGKTQDLE
ncbi:Hypothetical_protein [Hexamita inflata]|uniref:Hypothetical_protein n=1 Tax=Hexamita inflata TaxID=28002 RepID=A0AA86QXF5_9EUKA|nr:Hypothetical protein HINF_LOCUS49268 [Hexamita inflata]CAI9961628.1 Hypothetical protein HINF_LOCUS49273 [Hexamita inflata]